VLADARRLGAAGGGKDPDRADAHLRQERHRLILHHVGQRTDEQKLPRLGGRKDRNHGGEAGVLALGEGRLDAGAGIVQDPHMGRVDLRQTLRRAGEVELDDLRRAGADEEQLLDVGTAAEELFYLAVEFFMGVGHAGQIALLEDRGAEAGLGEDHHAGGGLQEMRAGARSYHEEERVLHLAVQPDDAGEAAEDLPLAALLQDGGILATARSDGSAGWFTAGPPHRGGPASASTGTVRR
jgi:hypothetical protein